MTPLTSYGAGGDVYARPMVFDNRCDGFEYSTGGSCVVVSLNDRFYVVTALHVPNNVHRQYKPSQMLIPYEEGSEIFLPIKEAFVMQTDEHDDTDHKDILLLEVWQEKLDMTQWKPEYCFNLAWNDGATLNRETQYWLSGYPDELNPVDYERGMILTQAAHCSGVIYGKDRFIGVDEWNLDPKNGLLSYQGFSGGGAFSFTPIAEGQAHVRLEGIVLRATVEGQKAFILQSRLIREYILKQQAG